MCTLTAIPRSGGARLAFNRDEARSRPAALPPATRRAGRNLCAHPTDPAGGGTWIAVSDAGLVFALLNVSPGRWGPASRGAIIPALLSAASLAEAAEAALALDTSLTSAFRLIISDGQDLAEVFSDGVRPRLAALAPLDAPCLYTSSGLGDHLVRGPRLELFARMLSAPSPRAQDAFHRHRWPDAPHLSVCMSRPDARTVSFAVATITPAGVSLAYHPNAPDVPAPLHEVTLERGAFR
jgi:hypothetical protein